MEIKQFEDKNLAHYSYAIVSDGQMALVDPARDTQPYYEYAKQANARIVAVIETHPHADFVSSHLEIHQHTGASIYVSQLLGAEYAHQAFDDGDTLELGKITLKAINTPGHSPDSISILAIDEQGKQQAVFTGDTLFIGDCGRPDLREKAGAITAAREELAKQMYHSLREKLMILDDHVKVYPAHGAGSLCGKGLSDQNMSTIGVEKMSNWSLQEMSEEQFVKELTSDQPFIPKYFPYDVGINKKGADKYAESIRSIEVKTGLSTSEIEALLDPEVVVIDSRSEDKFKRAHLSGAINLMDDTKFETWLGAIVSPEEQFYLIGSDESSLRKLITRIAKIGYERQLKLAIVSEGGVHDMEPFDANKLRANADDYTLVDIRNDSEKEVSSIFKDAIHIPLHQLRERAHEIPTSKPIVVHCAGGYRSAAGSSIIKHELNGNAKVYDLSFDVKSFQQ